MAKYILVWNTKILKDFGRQYMEETAQLQQIFFQLWWESASARKFSNSDIRWERGMGRKCVEKLVDSQWSPLFLPPVFFFFSDRVSKESPNLGNVRMPPPNNNSFRDFSPTVLGKNSTIATEFFPTLVRKYNGQKSLPIWVMWECRPSNNNNSFLNFPLTSVASPSHQFKGLFTLKSKSEWFL